ncbi:MAG: DUF499 domain-containing protein [Candidatus Poribacteria bacterium]|nr:DUF499 domain-containing protein [Candidatus Poribacteria bacterium]
MAIIDRPNKDALTKAVDIYRDAMRAFIVRQLKQVQGSKVEEMISSSLLPKRAAEFEAAFRDGKKVDDFIDTTDFPEIIKRCWNEPFSRYFKGDRGVQNLTYLIHDNARNAAAHPPSTDFEEEKTLSSLQYIIDALGRINAPQAKAKVETIRDSLKQPTQNEETEDEVNEAEGNEESEEIKPPVPIKRKTGDMTPWREAIDLNPDVKKESGQAEYRADLQKVGKGAANSIYSDPIQFFKRTYISAGLRELLVNSLKRWNGKGGDPVVQTKIGFGGGKTHSLIALRHLATNPKELLSYSESSKPALARMTREIREIVKAAGLSPDKTPDKCEVAVLAGTSLSTTSGAKTEKGDLLNTLWGEMAHQLADQRGYEFVGEAARKGLAPGGDELDALFKNVGSFVILMDEIVAYTRNLPDQMQDRIYTFIQNLTEAVHRSKRGVLVVTLPSSAEEAGGVGGQEVQSRIENILGRVEAANEVLEIKESYEVVRRRLFEEVKDEEARDQTCEAFAKMYRNSSKNYPPHSRDPKYLEKMKMCYPIHPEVFDRLYEDWSAYSKFQRTRGVLRLMAACAHRLQNSDDPLIMPGDLPMDESNVKEEFARCLGGNWDPVFSEADGPDARVKDIDAPSKRFEEAGGAAQRIARATLLGSAQASARHGIDLRQIHLGVVKPGDGVTVYSDALKQMKEKLYYLYAQGGMHYFHVEPNLVRVAQDRIDKLTREQLDAHIVQKLNEATRRHPGVVVCPDETFMTDDQNRVTLAVLSPSESIPSRAAENDEATEAALKILTTRGDGSPRSFRNMIVFLAAKNDSIRELRRWAGQYLAWESIVNGNAHGEKMPGLKDDRLTEAKARLKDNKNKTEDALIRAYQHALYPRQPDNTNAKYEFKQVQTDADGDIVEAAFNKLIEEDAVADNMSAASLERFLDEYVWSREQTKDHIDIDKLWELFAQFVYMPRLESKSVLANAVAASVAEGLLGSASKYDEESGKYENLQYESKMSVWTLNDLRGLIVRKEAAQFQYDLKREDAAKRRAEEEKRRREEEERRRKELDPPKLPKLFTMTAEAKPDTLKQAVEQLENEIMPSLRNGEVSMRIIVTAKHARGFDENDARAVRENCKELGIELDEESDL